MTLCACCRDEADDILWQPFGPAQAPTLPLCETCHALVQEGARVHFRYKQQWWYCEGAALQEDPHG